MTGFQSGLTFKTAPQLNPSSPSPESANEPHHFCSMRDPCQIILRVVLSIGLVTMFPKLSQCVNPESWMNELTNNWNWQVLDKTPPRNLKIKSSGSSCYLLKSDKSQRTYLQQITALHDKAKSRKYCLTPKVRAYLRVFPSIIRAKSFSFRRASPRVVQWRLRVSRVPCKIK